MDSEKTKPVDIDRRVSEAFEDLINWAKSSRLIGKIAMQPRGQHERTIADEYCRLLQTQVWGEAVLHREYSQGTRRYDIVAAGTSGIDMVIEVKTPFTNHDGIRNKTRKSEHLPKDMDSLRAALDTGASGAYALITPIGCYPVDANEEMIVRDYSSIRGNEKTIKREFGLQWPTRRDYENSSAHGRPEVERAMLELARECNLEARQIKEWIKVVLPSPRSGILAFMDCTLYKVHNKQINMTKSCNAK